MADDVPGLDDKFRVPRNNNDLQLLNAARAFATDALPLKAQFIALELSTDFLEDLNGGIEAMQAAISDQSGGLTTRVNSGAAIDDAVGRGIEVVRKLGAIVKNKYGENPAVLAEWTSVSHTERAPRRSAGAETLLVDQAPNHHRQHPCRRQRNTQPAAAGDGIKPGVERSETPGTVAGNSEARGAV